MKLNTNVPWASLALVALQSLLAALMAPLANFIEISASRYTYNVGREFFSVIFVALAIAKYGVSWLGRAENRKWFVCLAASQWFFLCGYVKAITLVPGSTWAALHFGTYPIFATGFGRVLRFGSQAPPDEVDWGYFAYTLARNALVILLIGYGEIRLGSAGGAGWCLLSASAHGAATNVFRGLRNVENPLTAVLWSNIINVVTWLPPGWLDVRVPFLWPKDAPHGRLASGTRWPLGSATYVAMIACGALACSGMLIFAEALRKLPVAPASTLNAALTTLFALLLDITISPMERDLAAPLIGVAIFVMCSAIEIQFGMIPNESKEETVPLVPRQDASSGSAGALTGSQADTRV